MFRRTTQLALRSSRTLSRSAYNAPVAAQMTLPAAAGRQFHSSPFARSIEDVENDARDVAQQAKDAAKRAQKNAKAKAQEAATDAVDQFAKQYVKHVAKKATKKAKKNARQFAKDTIAAEQKAEDLYNKAQTEYNDYVNDAQKLAEDIKSDIKSKAAGGANGDFFDYTWGTWMKDDAAQKAKRRTEFSLDGLSAVLSTLNTTAAAASGRDTISKGTDGVTVLSKNLDLLPGTAFRINQVTSIHEGLFHRIYKLDLDNGESLILRLPYRLYPEYYLKRSIESEVATTDFIQSKLGLNVPKVLAYSGLSENPIKYPFVLTEYIEGESLVKQWNPLVKGDTPEVAEELKKVIDPIADFANKLTEFTFNGYGSLYFKDDLPDGKPAFDGSDRYVLGPTTMKPYYEKISGLDENEVDQYTGPWPASKPLKSITDLSQLVVESLQNKIATYQMTHDDNKVVDLAQSALKTYQTLLASSDKLLDLKNTSIQNIDELVAPRLFVPDLDPMNVIVKSDGSKWFVDFEDTTITPYVLNPFPKFVDYTGPRINNVTDVPDYDKLEQELKDQVEYMQQRTRNQNFWEKNLKESLDKLSPALAPELQKIREAYGNALKDTMEKDYLNVEKALVQLQDKWADLQKAKIVPADIECPIQFTQDDIDKFETEFYQFQQELAGTPFAATNGWVPQDLFEMLEKQGVIVKDGDDYKIDTSKIVEDLGKK